MPGPLGGHNWYPMAFSPKTGLVYIPTNEAGFPYIADEMFQPHKIGFNLGLDFAANSMPNDLAIQKATMASLKGYLLAWDPVKQKAVWRADHAGPANGGVVATAGNLVFQGTYAGEFAAYAADTGRKLWSFDAQAPIIAAPMTFEVGGEQYVAVLTGGGGAYALSPGIVSLKSGTVHGINRLLVFKLGGTAGLPAVPKAPPRALDPPPLTAAPAKLDEGFKLYSHYCGICHGDTAVSGRMTPDLRYTPLLASDGFFAVVLGGALKDQGMISFAPVLDHDQADSIRAYLIRRAHETRDAQAKGTDLSEIQAPVIRR